MNQNKMLKGYEKMMFNLACPYCGNEESVEFGKHMQYETFKLLGMDNNGICKIWVWFCKKCNKEFYTEVK